MCGRYAVTTDPALLAAELDAIDEVTSGRPPVNESSSSSGPGEVLAPRYNVAPTTTVMSVVSRHAHGVTDDDPALRIRAMRWGLVPSWTKDIKKSPLLFNARAEGLAEKASFKQSWKTRRCLIPMDGWYEWRTGAPGANGKPTKTPYFMSPADGTRVFMAGLWTVWRPRDADDPKVVGAPKDAGLQTNPLMSCTIITTEAVGALRDIHDRMPLIMPLENWGAWLDPDAPAGPEMLEPPAPQLVAAIERRQVPPLVNRVANDGPELLDPIRAQPEQGTLM